MKKLLSFYSVLILVSPFQFVYADDPLALPNGGETVRSLSCVYGLTPSYPGCLTTNTTAAVPQGGSGTIMVIDGGNDPDALNELNQFSSQMGLNQLPQCGVAPCFQTVYADSTGGCKVGDTSPTPVNIIEPEIDIQWSHAMAPNASIYMVQTDGWDFDSMMRGVQCANRLLRSSGGYISFSASFTEFPTEANFDSNFQTPGVIYVMSSGDYQAPARYPSASPYVVSAGGTMINRDSSGNYINQAAWQNTGIPCDPGTQCKTGGSGGPSIYESRPSYQNSVQKIVGSQRGTPDISFVAQNVDVFCCSYTSSTNGNEQCCVRPGSQPNPAKPTLSTCRNVGSTACASGWGLWVVSGGTSLAAPALTGIMNSSHSGARTSPEELSNIYNGAIKNYSSYWTDIISGNNGYSALKGYDFATGLGVPLGYNGK